MALKDEEIDFLLNEYDAKFIKVLDDICEFSPFLKLDFLCGLLTLSFGHLSPVNLCLFQADYFDYSSEIFFCGSLILSFFLIQHGVYNYPLLYLIFQILTLNHRSLHIRYAVLQFTDVIQNLNKFRVIFIQLEIYIFIFNKSFQSILDSFLCPVFILIFIFNPGGIIPRDLYRLRYLKCSSVSTSFLWHFLSLNIGFLIELAYL